MPEIPDLQAYAGFLNEHLPGRTITAVDVFIPYIVRTPKEEFLGLAGERFATVRRYAKSLIFAFDSERVVVIQAMLTGGYQWVETGAKKKGRTVFAWRLDDGHELRYVDDRVMGRIYLSDVEHLATVPHMSAGPDALDPALSEDEFRARIKRHRGQIKSVLTNEEFVAGIGNAYSDEILWWAKVHPYRKRTELTDDEVGTLYRAMHEVIEWGSRQVAEEVAREGISIKPREFLNVHRKGGQPCPRCGTTISEVTAGGRITNFCRTCQPGMSVRGALDR